MKKLNFSEIENTLDRNEMKQIMAGSGGSGCTYSNCSCLSTYDCYRAQCLDVYGTTSAGMACVEECNQLQADCIYDCNMQPQS